MDLIKELNKDLENGFSKRDLERLIGLPENCLSNILKGKKKLSRKSEIKIEKWAASEKPDPLTISVKIRSHILNTEKGVMEVNIDNGYIEKFTPIPKREKRNHKNEFPLNEAEIKKQIVYSKTTPESYNGNNTFEYDFTGKDFLVVEDYTKYPIKDIPKNQIQAQVYLNNKKVSDAEIRKAWAAYKSENK